MAAAEGENAARQALLAAIFGNSPFLTECALREPATVNAFWAQGPDAACRDIMATLRAAATGAETAAFDRALRAAKRRLALIVAMADIAGAWPVERVTQELSDFAALAADLALDHHFRALAKLGHVRLPDGPEPLRHSGIVVLGMGKLGAGELNYSSDIDLVVLYDPEKVPVGEPERLRERMIRLTHLTVNSLMARTADGYVFRVDLRLRPDPGATPVAVSIPAAEIYYESMGQNWERAAMIKARPVAGDLALGEGFLAALRPFIWRRSLDFAAIQDIHSIKRQIAAHHGGAEIAVAGHNVKLGRGGIREIEFFAQTQQLIYGGRDASLRGRGTCDSLRALARAGRNEPAVAEALIESYRFLRHVEHRLQMVDDQQTQTLPEDPADLAAIGRFCGFDGADDFAAALRAHLARVEKHYARLFEEAPTLSAPGNLVFTGTDHDPETLKTIAGLGYREPETISALIRGWHHGRYRAMRSARAREIVTELVPGILAALAKSANPDDAFKRFDAFMAGLPAGVPLFSLLHANPNLLGLVAEILGSAPRIAENLARRAALIDNLINPAFFKPLPPRAELEAELDAALEREPDYPLRLDAARRWARDREFQAGVQHLRGAIDAAGAGAALSDIADAVLARLLPPALADFALHHGALPGAEFCVFALGKFGGRELSATSDLDLVFVYDVPPGVEHSAGARPLAPSHWFARFAPRFLNALTAPTAEGKLYEVDLRLRPAGDKGPLASSFEAFLRYQREDAWTFEHMALTRARFVCGEAGLRARVEAAIRATLTRPREPEKLRADVASMRRRIAETHKAGSVWDVKHLRGGLVDVEFVAQYLQLRHAAERPEILSANTGEALRRLAAAGYLAAEPARILAEAARLWTEVQALLRLTVEGRFDPAAATDGLRQALARAGGAADFAALERRLAETAASVRAVYAAIVEDKAAS